VAVVVLYPCESMFGRNHLAASSARECCKISPPRFLAKCRMRRLNQGSFVLLYFVLFAFSGLCLVCVFQSFFNLSSVLYFPA